MKPDFRSITMLDKMREMDRIPHALMLHGTSGSGTWWIAHYLAQFILCSNRVSNHPCGKCNSCQKVDKLIHPDLHFSYPAYGPKVTSTTYLSQWRKMVLENAWFEQMDWVEAISADQKQLNITAEESLDIIKKLSLKPFEGNKKVLIVWLPEFLGKEGNRLLKMIEEPPEETYIIMVTLKPDWILPTILSRCQLVRCPSFSDEEVTRIIVSSTGSSIENAKKIAFLASGDLNLAFKLQKKDERDESALFLEWLRVSYKGDPVLMQKFSEQIASFSREKIKVFFQYGLHYFREYLWVKGGISDQVRLQEEEKLTADRMSQVISIDQAILLSQWMNHGIMAIERNANQKILILSLTLRMNSILREFTEEPVPLA
jgi:DNA polymerase III subunit delta'